jgi:biotin synthase
MVNYANTTVYGTMLAEGNVFNKKEITEILKNDSKNDWLFDYADKVRKDNVGDEVHLRGLVEFSNICKNSCKYCGLRCENHNIERYRILKDEILTIAKNAVNMGYKTIVLQSGEDLYYSTDKMIEIIEGIKNFDVALTLSVGERSYDDYKAFRQAGADRYLIRIETTDKELYKQMHPNMDFDNRIRCLKDLKELGYEVGTGCLVGLPNQTIESLADDILFFKEIEADMIGIGPFISHPQTPLKNSPNGNFYLALKVMALTRLMLPDINIPATTAMETLNPDGRLIALKSGANVVMPNVTTSEYRKKYEIYPNKICINEEPDKCRGCIEAKIKSIGRTISTTKGQSKHFVK